MRSERAPFADTDGPQSRTLERRRADAKRSEYPPARFPGRRRPAGPPAIRRRTRDCRAGGLQHQWGESSSRSWLQIPWGQPSARPAQQRMGTPPGPAGAAGHPLQPPTLLNGGALAPRASSGGGHRSCSSTGAAAALTPQRPGIQADQGARNRTCPEGNCRHGGAGKQPHPDPAGGGWGWRTPQRAGRPRAQQGQLAQPGPAQAARPATS